jgi:hypothetical protein
MFYVLRFSLAPAGLHAWGVAYNGPDQAEAIAAFDLIRLDKFWCLSKALVWRQASGLRVLDAHGVMRPASATDPDWLLRQSEVVGAIDNCSRAPEEVVVAQG